MRAVTISIITITYNDLDGLIKTVSSIDKFYAPIHFYISHTIIDGGSFDGTCDFMSKIETSRRISTIFISEKDNGIYDAMNKGVLNSESDYVIFINSGDTLLSNFFEDIIYNKLLNIVDEDKYAGLALSCIYNFGNKNILIKARDINSDSPRMPSLHQGIIYKRNILIEYPYSLNYKICGDFENICRIINKYKFDYYNIEISELFAGGISTSKPLLLFSESYKIYVSNFSPNFYNKIKYISRILFSIRLVQILNFYFIKFSKKS